MTMIAAMATIRRTRLTTTIRAGVGLTDPAAATGMAMVMAMAMPAPKIAAMVTAMDMDTADS